MKCFTFTLSTPDRKMKEISTPVSVAACSGHDCRVVKRCNAIWDTGATSSMIARRIARELQLSPTGVVDISGVHGVHSTETYKVDLLFGNGFQIPGLQVSAADDNGGFDVLIGMDIISSGRLIVDGINKGCYIRFEFPAICD